MGGKQSKDRDESDGKEKLYMAAVAVGDRYVGKTTLVKLFGKDKTEKSLDCCLRRTYRTDDNKLVTISLYDPLNNENSCAKSSYRVSQVILLCFSVVIPSSFESLRVWQEQLKFHLPHLPESHHVILVGCQKDLRKDERTRQNLALKNLKPITEEQGKEFASEMGIADYMECSAKTGENVNKIFENVIDSGIAQKRAQFKPLPQGSSVKRAGI